MRQVGLSALVGQALLASVLEVERSQCPAIGIEQCHREIPGEEESFQIDSPMGRKGPVALEIGRQQSDPKEAVLVSYVYLCLVNVHVEQGNARAIEVLAGTAHFHNRLLSRRRIDQMHRRPKAGQRLEGRNEPRRDDSSPRIGKHTPRVLADELGGTLQDLETPPGKWSKNAPHRRSITVSIFSGETKGIQGLCR